MKMPESPKPLAELLSSFLESDLSITHGPCIGGQYLHWDKLRHKTPPEGLTHEQWWAGTKISRGGILKETSLRDPLGAAFRFALVDPLFEEITHIDREAGRQTSDLSRPKEAYLMASLIMEEAITSSQLEGASTTRRDAKDMIQSGRKPRDRSELMILNNYRAMAWIREHKDEKLTPDDVRLVHRIVTEGTLDEPADAGRLRGAGDADIGVWAEDDPDLLLHRPVPWEELPERIESLCQFANGEDDGGWIHPVVRSILLHFWLAYDHPFVDGNGRTSRALFYWSMLHQEYELMKYVSISHVLKNAKAAYGRAFLYVETDDNDLTYFIAHQLKVIRRAIDALKDYIKKKEDEQQKAQALLRAHADKFNHRQRHVLITALRRPGGEFTSLTHGYAHAVTLQTARNDLGELVDLGLLEVVGKSRPRRYRPPVNLATRIRQL